MAQKPECRPPIQRPDYTQNEGGKGHLKMTVMKVTKFLQQWNNSV